MALDANINAPVIGAIQRPPHTTAIQIDNESHATGLIDNVRAADCASKLGSSKSLVPVGENPIAHS
jgi:hypothetical protein